MSDNETTNETTMTEKLQAAGEKAEKQKAERQARVVKGSHLLAPMLERATAAGCTSEDMSGFTKLTLASKSKRILLAKKGGRVDLSGFTVDQPGVKQISAEEAKAKHLGKVRAMLDFDKSDEEVLAAFDAALVELAIAPPEPVKAPAKKKEQPVEAATETPAEAQTEEQAQPETQPVEAETVTA